MQDTTFHQIKISEQQASQIIETFFGMKGEIKKLPGEVDFNFRIQVSSKEKYTLKVSRPETDWQDIEFQIAAMRHVQEKNLPFAIPYPIANKDGSFISEYQDASGRLRLVRLQKWVSGRVLDELNPRSPNLLYDWGKTGALLSLALQNFDHPSAHKSYKWNPSETLLSKPYAQYIHDVEQKEIAEHFWAYFAEYVQPHLEHLPRGINHNDLHEFNVLADDNYQNPKITGIIDFGDALYTESINELAIICAYAGMDFQDPLSAIAELVKGYHETKPLSELEIEVLYGLIAARLLITVANAALNKHLEPDNAYLTSSEQQAWDLLKKWKNISPKFACYTFRHVCGFEPCPTHSLFKTWANANNNTYQMPVNLQGKKLIPLDLQVGSLDLGNNVQFESAEAFQKNINNQLIEAKAEAAIGGYGEVRPIYTADAYEIRGNNGPQWRTVHLGTDIWIKAGTPVRAFFAGKIHSLQNNSAEGDYGPTLILEHKISEALTFYTLYGHLSADSIADWTVGQEVKTGEQIAEIGSAPENGNWPPHLHFQIILDMLENEGDFPGVAFHTDSAVWLSICPDVFSQNTNSPILQTTINAAQIKAARQRNLGKSLSLSYSEPLHMVRGYKQYLYDSTGRRYLDTCNNVPHVGHQHPRVVKALQKQASVLNTNTRYLHKNITKFAEELAATFPPELSVVHFVNSGSEANELALRMARNYTNQRDMVAVEVGYHGNTGGTIDISSYKFDGKGGKGAPTHTHIVPMPDTYRGRIQTVENAGEEYAEFVQEKIKEVQAKGRNIAGFICESILSCGGQIVLPTDYLKNAYQHIRAAGGLCIADEVQVGFGRIGSQFWGFELQGVVPDIVTLGKPIGNGHPLAAVVTTPAVAEAFANGMEYFNTFGGNPVSCAIGHEVLQVIKDENLQQNALQIGDYLRQRLEELQSKYPIIGDVRGHGFFLGFELVKDRETREPAASQAAYYANRMKDCGILTSTDGPDYNVIKIKPPMCFTRENADFFIEMTDKILAEDVMKLF